MQNTKAYAINFTIDGYETLNSVDVMKTAETLRTDYPKVGRIIGIDSNVIPSIKAALKTASGIASAEKGIITTNVHNLSKVELAVLIAPNDNSDEAFDRTAFEIARDAFTAGDLNGKAQALAGASGRTQEACLKLINAKLSRKKAELVSHLKSLKDIGQAPLDAGEVRDYILSTAGAALLALPTAYGKTSKIIEPVLSEEMARGSKVLVISHRRSINRNIAQLQGIVSYDECDTPDVLQNAQGLKTVVNSLSAHKFKSFIEAADVVVIDEASQVIAHVLGGEVKHREAVWNALRFVVKNAKKVILADADINARCVELLADRPAKLFKIAQDHSNITVKTSDSSTVRGLIVKAAAKGERVLVACDGAREAAALGRYIEKKAKRPVLVITAENAKWIEQAAFIADPNSMRASAAKAEVVHAVKDAGSKDETEYLSVVRARAQEVMGRTALSFEDAKLWGEGEGEAKIKLFRRLYSLNSSSQDDELAVFSKILPAIAEMSLTKGWRSGDSAELFDSLNAVRSKVIGLGINMSRANTQKAKQAAVTNILKCFGIKTRKVAGTESDYYIVDQESLNQMASYFKAGAPL